MMTFLKVLYWLCFGLWWALAKWMGRLTLWLIFPLLGLWRSSAHGRDRRLRKALR